MAQSNTDSMVDSSSSRLNDSGRWRAEQTERAEREREEAERQQAEARPAEARPAEGNRSPAPEASDSVRHAGEFEAGDPEQLWQRWWQIQSSFVDAPRSAVAEGHALVSGIVDGLVRQLEGQRSELEQRWSSGQEISTEELRCDLQRYRDFLGRLVSKLDDKNKS